MKKTPLYVPILWLITGILWTITFVVNLSWGYAATWLIVLQGLTAAISFVDAYVHYKRYKKGKDE